LYYAKGSLSELVTQLYIGIEVGYLAREPALLMVQEAKELAKILGAIIKQKQSKSKS
jgi:four helix bundle protein